MSGRSLPPSPPGPSDPARRAGHGSRRPRLLVLACALVLVEVAALVAAAAAGLVALVRGGDVGQVLFLVALALGAALLLAQAARGLWAGRRWGRGPVLTAQILVVVTAGTWWGAGGGVVAVGPVALALLLCAALLSPSVLAATSQGRAQAG